MLWKLSVALGGSYLGLVLLVYLFQARLLYLPRKALDLTPAAAGLPFEDIRFRTDDGLRLHGWFIPAGTAAPTLLFFHGNAGNISDRLESLRIFRNLGLNVLIFDYRGYGRSEGTPSEPGTYLDARAAWGYLTETRGIPPDQIILFGRSLGGAIAAALATRVDARGLILESAFTSVPDLAAEIYPFLPIRILARIRYDTLGRIPRIRSPLLVIHSVDDEIIPYRHGQALLEAAPEPKELLTIRGGHNDGFLVSAGPYRAGLREFLDGLRSPPR